MGHGYKYNYDWGVSYEGYYNVRGEKEILFFLFSKSDSFAPTTLVITMPSFNGVPILKISVIIYEFSLFYPFPNVISLFQFVYLSDWL